ncbi:MAG: hypothetical protein ACLU0O_03030 [Collinsella sp.]
MGAEDNLGRYRPRHHDRMDFKADDKGMTYPEPMDEIPAEFADIAATKRESSSTLLPALTTSSWEDPHGGGLHRRSFKAALRKGVLANELNLVFVAPPTRTRASRPLDAVVDYLPARSTSRPSPVPIRHRREIERHPSFDEPFSGLVFKIMTDPFVGAHLRPRLLGRAESGPTFNASNGQRERLGHPRDERRRAYRP